MWRGDIFLRNEKEKRPFFNLALAIPAAEAAAGRNWLPTLVLALAAAAMCIWMNMRRRWDYPWLLRLQRLGVVFLLAGMLEWTHSSWPGEKAEYAIPAVLLLLAVYAAWRGSEAGASSVLRYGVYLVLGVLALFGALKIRPEELLPRAELPSLELAWILLLPLIWAGRGENPIPLNGFAALVSALLTAGYTSLYAFSRSLSIGATDTPVESLAACALTVGWFAGLCYVLSGVKKAAKKDASLWRIGLFAYGIYVLKIPIPAMTYLIMELTIWLAIPLACSAAAFGKKFFIKLAQSKEIP